MAAEVNVSRNRTAKTRTRPGRAWRTESAPLAARRPDDYWSYEGNHGQRNHHTHAPAVAVPPPGSVPDSCALIGPVLHRSEVMREQLMHLLDIARLPEVTIQIVPSTVRAHCGMAGGFIIAERNGHPYAAYTDAQPFGRTFDDRRLIAELVRLYDALRAEAVPFSQSLRLIEEAVNHDGPRSSGSAVA
ncbi:Scr1 family TA system antitoxin-like transcriptional regulator [Sphaerisporangium sp. NPDC051011]|uniref:Scr1 family TA system antitoxin-like transcriptional regulator n=1 Tax=Sphaerisporangium sp. NPDC051011 TaxID=3155792 RepID=UPI0034101114